MRTFSWLGMLGIVGLVGLLGGGCHKPRAKEASLLLYSGFATAEGGVLYGRVSSGPPDPAPTPGESKIARIQETLQALDASALAKAPVEVTVAGHVLSAVSDERGYLEVKLPAQLAPPKAAVEAHLRHPGYHAAPVQGTVLVYDGSPGLAVVSDVDDTLLDSQITDRKKMIENALTKSTWELAAFADAPQVLGELSRGLPVFYLSGSPWGFHARISSYFQRVGFPEGTLVLKRFSREPLLDQMGFKYPHLRAIVAALPSKKFVLFGDSGEKDPEIYARLRTELPSRVEKIYIHLVTSESAASPRFAGMQTFTSWSELRPKSP
ncbi:MAG: DUF2183 domain-containing protein [Myxococcales bacterium]|nr:DUF2183 domain-containing protein [Myxococcales bacterium]